MKETYFNITEIEEENYYNDEKDLINFFYKNQLIQDKKNTEYTITPKTLELIIRPECDQACDYCYIHQYGKDLYPQRLNKSELLKNINIIFNFFFLKNKAFSHTYQIFAGDLFYDDIFFDLLDLFEKYFLILKNKMPILFFNQTTIMIPNSLTFISNQEKKEKTLKYIDKFFKEYNTKIKFSWSTDGLYAIETREKKNLDEKYFDDRFKFCKKTHSWYHPMISACNIKNYIKNYEWWFTKIKQHYSEEDDNLDNQFLQPMFLEVRNNDWTQENINDYLKLLDYAFEKRFEACNKDSKNFAYHMFIGDGKDNTLKQPENYDFINFPIHIIQGLKGKDTMTCGVPGSIVFNCSNLSLVPCHRTTYPQFTGGYINDQNNELIPKSVSSYITLTTIKRESMPVCSKCIINEICLHGCLGAQYEKAGDIMLPCSSVCNLFKQKFYHLLKLYDDYNLFNIGLENNYISEEDIEKIYILIEKLRNEIEK